MKILLVGGGTLGSVNPLIAVYEEGKKRHPGWQWFWVGTEHGAERELVATLGLPYEWLPAAKLRRYLSWRNLIDPFLFIVAFWRSLLIIMTIKPDVILGVGSFLTVPVVWASALLRKTIIIHQQDIRPGLANKLSAPFARQITVSFESSLYDYSRQKTEWIGNPVRSWLEVGQAESAQKLWNLDKKYPTVLIMGGSSGATGINDWVWQHVSELTKAANVIHLTGLGKSRRSLQKPRYTQIDFLQDDMAQALAAANLVVSRAGISTLTELAELRKAAILIPIPGTHQEDNARYFARAQAAIFLSQAQLNDKAVYKVFQLLSNPAERAELGRHMGAIMKPGARERLVEILSQYEY